MIVSCVCYLPLFCHQVGQSELDVDLVKTILSEYKIHNADITLRYDATAEDLIDVIEGNRVYIPCIYLLNKIDQISIEVSQSAITLSLSPSCLSHCSCLEDFWCSSKCPFNDAHSLGPPQIVRQELLPLDPSS